MTKTEHFDKAETYKTNKSQYYYSKKSRNCRITLEIFKKNTIFARLNIRNSHKSNTWKEISYA